MPGEYEFLYLIGEKSSPVVDSERPTSCPAPCNRAAYKVPMIPAPSTSILIQHLAHHHYPLFSVTNAEVAGRKAGSLFVANGRRRIRRSQLGILHVHADLLPEQTMACSGALAVWHVQLKM
ncbi:MAG: hypothetical protein WBV28_00150 [Terracidiphilus sp.]